MIIPKEVGSHEYLNLLNTENDSRSRENVVPDK